MGRQGTDSLGGETPWTVSTWKTQKVEG